MKIRGGGSVIPGRGVVTATQKKAGMIKKKEKESP